MYKIAKNLKRLTYEGYLKSSAQCTLKLRIHKRAEWFTNLSRTKCAYVCLGLRTCAAPSMNGSHTVCHKPKFVGFLCKHKENWMCQVSFLCTGCPWLTSGLWNRTQTAQCVSDTLVYTRFNARCRELRQLVIVSVCKLKSYKHVNSAFYGKEKCQKFKKIMRTVSCNLFWQYSNLLIFASKQKRIY